jgi:tRNA A37 threonylcarbamoyladenosine dehydratase
MMSASPTPTVRSTPCGNVGLAKAEVMAERIRLINPECRVTVVDDFVTPENVAEYLGVGFSYVIDAIDSVRPKAALIAYCRRYKCRW